MTILREVGQFKNFNNMYDIVEVTINGKKVNPKDIVVK